MLNAVIKVIKWGLMIGRDWGLGQDGLEGTVLHRSQGRLSVEMTFELKTKRRASPSKSWNDSVVDARRGIERLKEVPRATKRCGMGIFAFIN